MAYINQDAGAAGAAPAPAAAPPPGSDAVPAAPASDPQLPAAGPGSCLFCAAPAAPRSEDRANLLLWRDELAFVMLNRYPYNAGHLMIIPYRHLADVTALTPAEGAALFALLQRLTATLTA